jgi:crossover junction endodeoxyribonuclease RuvC
MIVIGVDPGTRHLGWGVVRRDGTRPMHVAHGVIDTDVSASIAVRLCQIETELKEVIATFGPTASVVEALFFAKDAIAAAKLGHARGVVLLVLARAGLSIAEYEPTRIKKAIVGHGRADKRQVAMMIATILRLPAPPRPDAADALAAALAHLNAAHLESTFIKIEQNQMLARSNRTGRRPRP